MEAFLVNETNENVWFDDFSIMSTGSPIVQETHYDPWGLELTGLGFQASGMKVNKYLYNGKELQDDLNLGLYDYGARFYDPAIGRWSVPDPMSEMYQAYSPYNYTLNNPVRLIDPNGMWVEEADRFSTYDPNEIRDFISQQQGKGDKEKTYEGTTLPEFTVSAPRSFDGVLGRAADKWMADRKNYSTFGNIGFNTNNISTSSISLFEGSGFYLNGITPVGGIAMELEKVRYTGDNGKKTSDWFFTVRTGWGLDVGMGGMVTKYNTQGSVLRNGNIEGASAHLSILNYQNTQSLNFSWQDGLQIGQTTGHSMSIGVSPTFPVKLSGSVGVGYTFNLSNLRR